MKKKDIDKPLERHQWNEAELKQGLFQMWGK